jgi:hypothetical protein
MINEMTNCEKYGYSTSANMPTYMPVSAPTGGSCCGGSPSTTTVTTNSVKTINEQSNTVTTKTCAKPAATMM